MTHDAESIRASVRKHLEKRVGRVFDPSPEPTGFTFRKIFQWECPTCGYEIRNHHKTLFERTKRRHVCPTKGTE